MENFVVSARKYRPKGFDEVVGQKHITTTLKNAIDNDHLAQSLLFCGPRGVGKTTCARILARLINDFEVDNMEGSSSLNIYELDAASNNSVDDVRNLIDKVRVPPQHGKYKVYIIDEVHMLSNAAFNAFLKTLEEPPSYAIFILATTEKHKVIPTILSRCQIYDFNRIKVSDISDHLKEIATREGIEVEDAAMHLIAQKADGALRDALSIFDLIVTFSPDNKITYQATIDNLHILDYDYYFKVTDALNNEKISEALLLFDEILKNGFDGHNFINGLAAHFRDLLVCKDESTLELLEVSEQVKSQYKQQAAEVSPSFLLSGLQILSQTDQSYKASKNQRLAVELALMKLAKINSAIDLAKQQDAVLKKKSELSQSDSEEAGNEKPSQKSLADQIAAKATQTKPLKSAPSIPKPGDKIKSTQSDSNQTSEPENEAEKQNPVLATQNESDSIDFNESSLKTAIVDFIDTNKIGPVVGNSLKNSIKLEGEMITVELTNPVEVDGLEKIKADFLTFIRRKFQNNAIQLQHEVNIEKAAERPYTPKEKFEAMLKENPLLGKLKDTFGLDTDY